MTTNKPEVVAWRWRKPVVNDQGETVGATAWELNDTPGFLPWWENEPLIRLSDYEALQAECEKLRRDVGPDVDVLTGALERVKIADDEPMHHARHGSAYWNSAVIACIDAVISARRKGGDK